MFRIRRAETMRPHDTLIALCVIAALSACARHDKSPDANPVRDPAPATRPNLADPMAGFARMVGGEWRRPAMTSATMFDTWHWGPGRHSMLAQTYGTGAAGEPWRELQVFYWHPGRKQVRLLGLSPFARGVSEGTIRFEGEAADAVFDLYQTRGRRKMGLRWAFDGPDKYHAVLLEDTGGGGGLEPMNEWDFVRFEAAPPSPGATRPPTAAAEEAPKPSERLKALEPLLGHTWEATGVWGGEGDAGGDAFHIQTTFEYVPYADAICARTYALMKEGEPTHLLDAYLYHHTGTGVLRCLALSDRGAVYEGDLIVLDGGALQLDLKGYEDGRVVPHTVGLDFEEDGTLRQRIWSVQGAERTLMLDVHHKRLQAGSAAP